MLIANEKEEEDEEEKEEEEEDTSECSNSLYAMYDPFDYMYSPSECSQHSDPMYAAVTKNRVPTNIPPPLPPRNRTPVPNSSVSFNVLGNSAVEQVMNEFFPISSVSLY